MYICAKPFEYGNGKKHMHYYAGDEITYEPAIAFAIKNRLTECTQPKKKPRLNKAGLPSVKKQYV